MTTHHCGNTFLDTNVTRYSVGILVRDFLYILYYRKQSSPSRHSEHNTDVSHCAGEK